MVFVPYLVLLSNNFRSSADYFPANCAVQEEDKAAAKVATGHDDLDNDDDDDVEPVAMQPNSMTQRRFGDLLVRRGAGGTPSLLRRAMPSAADGSSSSSSTSSSGGGGGVVDLRAKPAGSRIGNNVGMRAQAAEASVEAGTVQGTDTSLASDTAVNVNPDGLFPVS